jgi:hypothetical protein
LPAPLPWATVAASACDARSVHRGKVELIPEAMPARSGVTTPIAVDASGGLIIPAPAPATMDPGIRCVQPVLS